MEMGKILSDPRAEGIGQQIEPVDPESGEEVAERVGIIAAPTERFREHRHRLVCPPRLPQHDAERERGFRQRPVEPHRGS